jgi:hypothetical protein
MTPTETRALPEVNLLAYFDHLDPGPAAPLGAYDGVAWSFEYPLTADLANLAWKGKVFAPDGTVTNRVLGTTAITGLLYPAGLYGWVIDYPRLGLTDELLWAGWGWLGRVAFRSGWIWFTLTPRSPL